MTGADHQEGGAHESEPVWPDERPRLQWRQVGLWMVGRREERYHPIPDSEIEMEATPWGWTEAGGPYPRTSPLLIPVWIRWLVALIHYLPKLVYKEALKHV